MFYVKRFHSSNVLLVFIIATALALILLVLGCAEKKTDIRIDNMYEKGKTPTKSLELEAAEKPETHSEIHQAPQPSGIPWNEAKYHIGERTTVYGPVASTYYATGSKGKPTFINIGNAYPNRNRFTVLIWDRNRGNFPFAPENYYSGKTISVTGLITEYEGVPEIEVTSPGQIEVW